MTLDAYLAEVAKRCEEATPGPWFVTDTDWPEGYHIQAVVGAPSGDLAQLTNIPDARFIAHARTDLPTLLTMLQRARALEGYAVHAMRCDAWGPGPVSRQCSCGLVSILADLDQLGRRRDVGQWMSGRGRRRRDARRR